MQHRSSLWFSGSLFYVQHLEYRTINNYRSAISAFHSLVQGVKVGQHPLVIDLLKGASNERPPLPRYTYIWDVDTVIAKMKELPNNSDLPIHILSFKLITLLGLCAITRSSELGALNIKWMSKCNDCYTCSFGIRVKHSRQGKPAPPIKFYAFHENKSICPVDCLDQYLIRTKIWRTPIDSDALFLSVINPHKPVTKPNLTKWVSKMLSLSGIDTSKFKSHSMRSAASSKVHCKGSTIKDILHMGNWSRESTWQTFYHKPISTPAERFQKTLLQEWGALNWGWAGLGQSLIRLKVPAARNKIVWSLYEIKF